MSEKELSLEKKVNFDNIINESSETSTALINNLPSECLAGIFMCLGIFDRIEIRKNHTQALDVVSLKFGIPYFEYGYIPTQFLDEPMYACVEAELEDGESLGYWIDYAEHSVLNLSYETLRLLWTKTYLDSGVDEACFSIPKPQQRFTMYLNATTNSIGELRNNRTSDVFHGIYIGDLRDFFTSENHEQIWPDPNRVPGYLQSDYQCSDVYTIAANDTVTIRYNIDYRRHYIHKLTVQEDTDLYPLSNWEPFSPDYIINEELTKDGPSLATFQASKDLKIRIFYYTFASEYIHEPVTFNFQFTVSTHRIDDGLTSPETIIEPVSGRLSTSILCPRP
ncbi:hypothetical protein HCN44_006144 [Aphidius gifuensis]|uniref:Uncharacterized protein n=1 Tax=Aphidius gifuensis TaxID=684658 RepID=A0A834Y1M9_APHGI|nr:uncharacterized protein LOC122852466 [Aphidius gifuensis]KAF7997573.1 hypothetical protein HCN44_006144 [Aphidius gifuensis]